jgi:hypothetical protein
MQEKSIIKQNILKYLDFKGISSYKFYQESGITRGVLGQNNGMSEENTAKFLVYSPDINIEWLLTGKGSMLKSEACGDPSSTPVTHRHQEANSTESLEQLRKENAMQAKIIEGLEFKVDTLEKELSTLKKAPKDPILYKNVAEPAPELIKK